MSSDILLLDGAMGTYLEVLGESLHPTLWSAGHLQTDPQKVFDVHMDYLTAGADIITSNSYQISYEGFLVNTEHYIAGSINLARSAIQHFNCDEYSVPTPSIRAISDLFTFKSHQNAKFVAASIGTYGAHLANGSEYSGIFGCSTKHLAEWHKPKLEYLLGQKPDILAMETIPCLDEAKALLFCLRDIEQSKLPVSWLSITCNSASTMNGGDSIESFCRLVEDGGDIVISPDKLLIGVNCTHPQYVSDILQTMEDYSAKNRRLVAYPNRGDPWDESRHCYCEDPLILKNLDDSFLSLSEKWAEGHPRLSILGGCCRTHPRLIHALKERHISKC